MLLEAKVLVERLLTEEQVEEPPLKSTSINNEDFELGEVLKFCSEDPTKERNSE